MFILIVFAFLAGIVTILSPCILPVLPLVLSGSLTGGKRRPLGIVLGFVTSFTFFTLALTAIVKLTGVSPDILRLASIVIILGFGLALIVPKFQFWMEQFFLKIAGAAATRNQGSGFSGGIFLGFSLGLIWTPCVGPILASVIALAATSTVGFAAIFITLAYSLGSGIPMLLITYGGRQLLQRAPWLVRNSANIQKAFGVLMIITALAIATNLDRKFQSYILQKFPGHGVGLTKLETNDLVEKELTKLRGGKEMPNPSVVDFQKYPEAPELIPGGEWFNLPDGRPLYNLSDLRGKVVLVDFWTYTCINCIRTLPYLESWHEKYADKGLVIIGVHTPEFEFEKNPRNVAQAIKDFGLKYAIMQDNDYATWTAYDNHYWPAKYFIDKDGRIRNTHFGEGDYDESELLIQQLLKESGAKVDEMKVENKTYSVESGTPETYLGYGRIANFASPEKIKENVESVYSLPNKLDANQFAYSGSWNLGEQIAKPRKGAILTFDFKAKGNYLVMAPAGLNKRAVVKVYLDGKLIAADSAGADVKNGLVTVDQDRLYRLVETAKAERHLLKLEFLDDNAELFAFTFG